MSDDPSPLRRQGSVLLHCAAYLHPLLRGQLRQHLCAIEHPLPLCRRHIVQMSQLVAHPLLGLLRQIVKAGFLLEGTLLIGYRHTMMTLHPLRQRLSLQNTTPWRHSLAEPPGTLCMLPNLCMPTLSMLSTLSVSTLRMELRGQQQPYAAEQQHECQIWPSWV
jgi:hypothetical protein